MPDHVAGRADCAVTARILGPQFGKRGKKISHKPGFGPIRSGLGKGIVSYAAPAVRTAGKRLAKVQAICSNKHTRMGGVKIFPGEKGGKLFSFSQG